MARSSAYIGRDIVLGIRPENISDAFAVAHAPENCCGIARVEVSEPMGAETFLYLDSGGHSFIAKVASGSRYTISQNIKLCFDLDKIHLFDPETEQLLV